MDTLLQIKPQIYTKLRHKYNKLTTDAITLTTKKKIPDKISNKVNADGKKIIGNKETVNRLFDNGRNSCSITLKDHEPHFLNNPKVR